MAVNCIEGVVNPTPYDHNHDGPWHLFNIFKRSLMTNNSLQNLNISYYNCIDQISKCFHFQNFLLTKVKPDSVAHLNFFASCSKRDNSNKKI